MLFAERLELRPELGDLLLDALKALLETGGRGRRFRAGGRFRRRGRLRGDGRVRIRMRHGRSILI